jgi:hypothetical protein
LSQRIAIILRIAEDRAGEFETMFAEDELPIWDEYTSQGLFLSASLTRVEGGSENPGGNMGGGPTNATTPIPDSRLSSSEPQAFMR